MSRSCVFWDVGYIQNTQERLFFQVFLGDTPAAEVCSPVTFEKDRGVYTSYKIANMLVEFSTRIPRTQLRPG